MIRACLPFAALAALLAASPPARAQIEGPQFDKTAFDKPRTLQRLTIPPHTPDPEREVVCTAYPGFTVKQVSATGDMGAEAIAILPAPAGRKPPCQLAPLPDERAISLDLDFPGVEFAGAKGEFVFLASSDAVHDAMGFAVLRAGEAKVLFHDWSHSALTFETTAGGLIARYTRTVGGDCSVLRGGATCAAAIGRASGAAAPAIALCKAGYASSYAPYAADRCRGDSDPGCDRKARAETDESPSVVEFAAELSIAPAGASARALGPPTRCWPAE